MEVWSQICTVIENDLPHDPPAPQQDWMKSSASSSPASLRPPWHGKFQIPNSYLRNYNHNRSTIAKALFRGSPVHSVDISSVKNSLAHIFDLPLLHSFIAIENVQNFVDIWRSWEWWQWWWISGMVTTLEGRLWHCAVWAPGCSPQATEKQWIWSKLSRWSRSGLTLLANSCIITRKGYY